MIAMLQVDPQGMGCLWEQMCHPLATVVLFPQCPGGSSLGKKRTQDNALGKPLAIGTWVRLEAGQTSRPSVNLIGEICGSKAYRNDHLQSACNWMRPTEGQSLKTKAQ